jgi:4-carboxymuconolactone decarboxylase
MLLELCYGFQNARPRAASSIQWPRGEAEMPRIPYVPADKQSDDIKRLVIEHSYLARLPNVVGMLAHADTMARGFVEFGVDILARNHYSEKLREMIIVMVASLDNCDYAVFQHRELAKVKGATEAQLQALERGAIPEALFEADALAALRFCACLVRDSRPPDELLMPVLEHFSAQTVGEFIYLTGYYLLLSRLCNTYGIERDEQIETAVSEGTAKAATRKHQ